MQLPANTAWFTVTINNRTDFQVYAFSGHEAVSQPYAFTLELVHPRHDEPLTDFIGTPVLLTVFDRSGIPRLVHGLVHEMSRLHRGNHLTHYQCSIVPRFWFLGKNSNYRIFQDKNVRGIITQILQEQGFASETFAFKCSSIYPCREYCVQYGESDLHFISRLCEEEGIYYYFEHSIHGHCLCFSDTHGGLPIPGESLLRYTPSSGQTADTSVVSRVTLHAQAVSDKATYRDWNFLTPPVVLEATINESSFQKAPVAPGIDYDTYRYPYLYQSIEDGERYAKLQLLRQLTHQTWIEAQSDASRFMPGFIFSLYGHDCQEANATWWITSVVHNGIQPQVLGRETPESGMSYAAYLECIPEHTRFVPAIIHPKYRITGDQTALVTGPEGKEIDTDKHGRVKVQFFWDHEGKQDKNTSCWIRASQGWAGAQYGTMAVPRIGHEVIVSFLEGDPDRPLITGRLYHANNRPPYALPINKTRTVFKSMSTPRKEGAQGFNEFRIEDKKGQEEIYAHAEKDVAVYVKNDWKEHIIRDKRSTTDNNTDVNTEGETYETLKKQRKTELFAHDYQIVHADSHTKIDDKWLTKVDSEVYLYAGEKAVFEAGTEATLKGGGSWIKFDPAGVFMDGPVITLGDEYLPSDVIPATVASAPAIVDLSNMQKVFAELWGKSFPNGKSQEFGGTIVRDTTSGELTIINTHGGTSGTFTADLSIPPGKEFVGVFHTHPYAELAGIYTGVSFSPQDIANSLNTPQRKMCVVQSGDKQFMIMRTAETKSVNREAFKKQVADRIDALRAKGVSFKEAVNTAAKEAAVSNGLAYYEGSYGKFFKVQ